jgi:hypothetical protein
MRCTRATLGLVWLSSWLVVGCTEFVERPPPPAHDGVYGFAGGCFAIDATRPGSDNTRYLEPDGSGEQFRFSATRVDDASRFRLRASDLGTYLLYDTEAHYLVAAEGELGRETELLSDILLLDDGFRSPAEWELEVSAHDPDRFQLRNYQTGAYLTTSGTSAELDQAAVVALYLQEGCAEFPELSVDATGTVEPRRWEDGALWGVVETHAHLFTNVGFGGGGIFHGAPFHRLGVEHALPSCELFHGVDGRRDLLGYAYRDNVEDPETLLAALVAGELPEFDHHTAGYPEFTDWPNSWGSSTHQTMYYRWLERAYLGGLRLLVQHATSNSVLCDLMVGSRAQEVRYACNDMVAVDRSIDEVYNLERYIDAQAGGPGQGWFRIVHTPAEARAVIDEGKLAVVLGIETANLFDCFLTTPEGVERCDAEQVRAELDHYYERGVRAVFPVHKYDNAFGAGDGSRGIIELGNFINSGHFSNFIEDCPGVPTVFDRGDVTFGGLNQPREDFDAEAPADMSAFGLFPVATLGPFLAQIREPPLEGVYCQGAGLTPLGETLIDEMMLRGMIIEVDHLPQRSYQRAFEMLIDSDYPAAGTHGNTNDGLIYQLGGVSKTGLGRCGSPDRVGAMGDGLRARIQLIIDNGGYPAEGFGFDLNGFAHGPRPRFGEHARCGDTPQANPITYPFASYGGEVTFTEPRLGNRVVDFDTEGMIHIGLMPELVEDARRDGVTDEELEPLFRSAEAYVRMWERAEQRGAALRARGGRR